MRFYNEKTKKSVYLSVHGNEERGHTLFICYEAGGCMYPVQPLSIIHHIAEKDHEKFEKWYADQTGGKKLF